MRVDCHQHYWRYEPSDYPWISDDISALKRDVLPDNISPMLNKLQFDAVIAVQARQSIEENNYLLNLAEKYEHIKGVIGWLEIRSKNISQDIEIYENSKMKGFRHQIQDEPNPSAFFEDKYFNSGVERLLKAGYLYELLFKEPDLIAATKFCQRHDNYSLVIDHLGKPEIIKGNYKEWRKKLKLLADLPNVYCKLSGLITEAGNNWTKQDVQPYIDIAIELFTPQRLMYGSDWPVCELSGNYEDVYSLINNAIQTLSQTERNNIFGNVAKELYSI